MNRYQHSVGRQVTEFQAYENQAVNPVDIHLLAGSSKALQFASKGKYAVNEQTSINMLNDMAWVIGDMTSRGIAVENPITHRSYGT